MKVKMSDPHEINRVLYPSREPAEYKNSLEAVTEEDRAFYREMGYLASATGFTGEQVANAKQALDEMMELRRLNTREQFDAVMQERNQVTDDNESAYPQADGLRGKAPFIQLTKAPEGILTEEEFMLRTRKIADFVQYDRRFLDIAFHPELLRVVELLLGEKPKLVQSMALLKPPQGGGEKPWHQDMAYRGLDFERPIIGVWIALDEAGIDNGCMHIIPRSHMRGGTPHYAERDWQMCDENVDPSGSKVVPLQPGGMLFFHGMLHHGTPSNFTAKRRQALQFHYGPASAELITPQEYKRMFTNEMSGAQC